MYVFLKRNQKAFSSVYPIQSTTSVSSVQPAFFFRMVPSNSVKQSHEHVKEACYPKSQSLLNPPHSSETLHCNSSHGHQKKDAFGLFMKSTPIAEIIKKTTSLTRSLTAETPRQATAFQTRYDFFSFRCLQVSITNLPTQCRLF